MSAAFTKLHPKIQEAVWQLKWEELHPLQVDSIHAVLDTHDHLILAGATATGKTEAAFLPILSLLAKEQRSSLQALYISPLVALINDQFRRLESLCEKADIAVHRRHSGIKESERQRMMRTPSGVLLITPESLEAFFIRRSHELTRLFCELQFVVIDELHSFLGNVRGVHLLSLLKRLEVMNRISPRYFGLSATLGDFSQAKTFLSWDNPTSVRVVEDPSQTTSIRIRLKSYVQGKGQSNQVHNPDALPHPTRLIAEDIALHCRIGSHLVFCNARHDAELLTDQLRAVVRRRGWAVDPFVLHHGSISKDLREEAEQTLKSGQPVTAICTSTLEMGINIGSVKTVYQLDPTWSVMSLTQRVGRSGRKEDEDQVLRLYTTDEEAILESEPNKRLYPQLVRGIALIELLIQKWVEADSTERIHYSTCIHQVLSVLRQTGGCHAMELHNLLCIKGAFRQIAKGDFIKLLRYLKEQELIEQMKTGEVILAPAGEKIVEARDFYAAFLVEIEYCVEHHGEQIGLLPLSRLPNVKESILLAGRRWQVEAVYHDQRRIVVVPAQSGNLPRFNGGEGIIDPRVMRQMREILSSTERFAYLDPQAARYLENARKFFLQSGLAEQGIFTRGNDVIWFPWAGTRAHKTLSLLAKADKIETSMDRPDKISITYHNCSIKLFQEHCKKVASGLITITQPVAVRQDRFDEYVAKELLEKVFMVELLDLNAAHKHAGFIVNGSSQR